MKIIIDKNIPYIQGIAEQYGEVQYLAGSEFTKENIKEAEALIVRTVKRFDKENLEGSNVELICSATIGYDHIDTDYCDRNKIAWKNAPGCNSGSVMQYIVSTLIVIAQKKGFRLQDKTIGIIGVGNVGAKVAKACQALGMRVLLNDPPRQRAEGLDSFVSLETICKEADIITFHTPLTKDGKDKTHHLANTSFFDSLKRNPIIINSARGGIVETTAIKQAIGKGSISGAIVDCWESEPNIDREYMQLVDIATPHIAGYSADGKANATRMSLERIAEHWNLSKKAIDSVKTPSIDNATIDFETLESEDKIADIILKTYNPSQDWQALLASPDKFAELRSNYPIRREYAAYTILNASNDAKETLAKLGFKV